MGVLTPEHRNLTPAELHFTTPSDPSPKALPSLLAPADVELSIVIPAYNESKRLPAMLTDTLAHLNNPKAPHRTVEIIVVDDGSTDDTTSIALQFASASFFTEGRKIDFRSVRLRRNRGKGGSVQAGLLGARGKRVLMVDADGASKFSDVELLWKELDRLEESGHKAAIAIGSRAHLVGTEAVVKVCFDSYPSRSLLIQ